MRGKTALVIRNQNEVIGTNTETHLYSASYSPAVNEGGLPPPPLYLLFLHRRRLENCHDSPILCFIHFAGSISCSIELANRSLLNNWKPEPPFRDMTHIMWKSQSYILNEMERNGGQREGEKQSQGPTTPTVDCAAEKTLATSASSLAFTLCSRCRGKDSSYPQVKKTVFTQVNVALQRKWIQKKCLIVWGYLVSDIIREQASLSLPTLQTYASQDNRSQLRTVSSAPLYSMLMSWTWLLSKLVQTGLACALMRMDTQVCGLKRTHLAHVVLSESLWKTELTEPPAQMSFCGQTDVYWSKAVCKPVLCCWWTSESCGVFVLWAQRETRLSGETFHFCCAVELWCNMFSSDVCAKTLFQLIFFSAFFFHSFCCSLVTYGLWFPCRHF